MPGSGAQNAAAAPPNVSNDVFAQLQQLIVQNQEAMRGNQEAMRGMTTEMQSLRQDLSARMDRTDTRMQNFELQVSDVSAAVAGLTSRVRELEAAGARPPARVDLIGNMQQSHPHFVSERIFLKGWCAYGAETTEGLSKAACEKVFAALVSKLPHAAVSLMAPADKRMLAPYFRNRQITVYLRQDPGREDGYELARMINACIADNNMTVEGRKIYAVNDAELWKKQRNACILQAEATCREKFTARQMWYHKDWASGALYVRDASSPEGSEKVIGSWHKVKGWQWKASVVSLYSDCTVAELEACMNARS
jgi:uncharacterized coiled-coil protein SlyX